MDNQNTKISNKTKIIIAGIIGALVIAGIVAFAVGGGNSEENKAPVKTEIATDVNGTPTVVQGTTPNGTIIENGTYPDGTQVEFATTTSGEYATESDGSYIINYVETVTVEDGQTTENAPVEGSKDESSQSESSNKNNSSSQTTASSKPNASSSNNNSSSKPSSSPANNSSSSSESSSGNSSSSSSSSSSGNSSSSSSSSSTNNSSSSSSSTTVTPPTLDGDAKATINGSSYKVGDKIRVSYYLQSPVKFCGIQCSVNYNSEVLKADTSAVVMDNLAGAMCNPALDNEIRFLSSAATAVNDFSKEKLLFSCEFEVLAATTSDVTLNVSSILDNDIQGIPSDKYTITAKIEKV